MYERSFRYTDQNAINERLNNIIRNIGTDRPRVELGQINVIAEEGKNVEDSESSPRVEPRSLMYMKSENKKADELKVLPSNISDKVKSKSKLIRDSHLLKADKHSKAREVIIDSDSDDDSRNIKFDVIESETPLDQKHSESSSEEDSDKDNESDYSEKFNMFEGIIAMLIAYRRRYKVHSERLRYHFINKTTSETRKR